MGVKTNITLLELKSLFPVYDFISIEATKTGIMDTTYFVYTKKEEYVLKRYERDLNSKIIEDIKLLRGLKEAGLNVPLMLNKKDAWYLYERLQGKELKKLKSFHMQELARFLAKYHLFVRKKTSQTKLVQHKEVKSMLLKIKLKYFANYKQHQSLLFKKFENDGVIHGDIFKDNVVFDRNKIGVFDFIDSGEGSFVFDAGVALFGFNIDEKNQLFINLFLSAYNQNTPFKIQKKELIKNLYLASSFYTLKRLYRSV